MGSSGSIADLPSPCFLVDEAAIERNLRIIDRVQRESGATVLLALKGFAMWSLFPLIREYLRGAAASSLCEARLADEHLGGGELHVYAPAYRDDQFDEVVALSDHLSFNSWSQWDRFRERLNLSSSRPQCAIRINPEHSEVKTSMYDSCAPSSRLGVIIDQFRNHDLGGISGLHFHNLCGSGAEALARTLTVVETKFGHCFGELTWINFGGGHQISAFDYNVELLIDLIVAFRRRYGLQVYLEPGEAVALNAGFLVATVLDVVHNDMPIAILDTSATAHMPDVLEMPYRPRIIGADLPKAKQYGYRLAGLSCLAGDVIGDYSFDTPLEIGQRLMFEDMAHYTMVKTTNFNGVDLPSIAILRSSTRDRDKGSRPAEIVRHFGYDDYKRRLS